MARARAVFLLLAAFRSHGEHAAAARVTTGSCVGCAFPPGAATGPRAAVTFPPPGASSGARARASSGALTPLGVPPRRDSRTPGDECVHACVGLSPFTRRNRSAVLAAYACAAIYSYIDSQDDEAGDSFTLPSCCYPQSLSLHDDTTLVEMARRGPPLPTKKDVEELKLILLLVLHELRKPKPQTNLNDWFTVLKPLIIEFLLDPRACFFYISFAAYLEQTFGYRYLCFECPFSELLELPSSPCFDPITENNGEGSSCDGDDQALTSDNIEWGKNLWPVIRTNTQGALAVNNLCYTKRSINEAAIDWGLKCLRYEIREISPPKGVRVAMEMQSEAERRKRAQILESEGAMLDQANRAKDEAEAILARSQATAEGIRMVSESMTAEGSTEAANLRVAEQYIKAFAALAKNTTTMLLPSDAGNPSAMVAQCMEIYKHTFKSSSQKGGSHQAEEAEEAHQDRLSDQPSLTSGMPLLGAQANHGSTFSLQRGRNPRK